MKRPKFNAARVTGSVVAPTNHQLQLVDTIGTTQELNLGPQAREQFLMALLARPPFAEGEQPATAPPRVVLRARSTRVYQAPDGTTGLEFHLSPGSAVHIELLGQLPASLRDQLLDFLK